MNSILSSDSAMNVKFDSLKFGPAMITERLFKGESLMDYEWIKSTFLVLVGFAIYQVLVRNLIKTDGIQNKSIKMSVDDILKFGVMLLSHRFLSGHPLNDRDWMKEVAYVLSGFVVYDVLVVRVYDFYNVSSFSKNTQMAIDDVLKFSTMFVVSRWLSGNEFNREWLIGISGFMTGLVLYDYFLSSW